jgi:hypothetical protein
MGRTVDIDELVSTSEIAERLHLKNAGQVTWWRRRYPDFPKPVAQLRIGQVYAFSDVEAWARRVDPQ